MWRVFKCTGQQVDKQLVNLSTRKFVTQKNFVHLLLCLSIILSFLANNSLTSPFVNLLPLCANYIVGLLYHTIFSEKTVFPHPEKTLHFLKQITLKSVQKPTSRATLQPTVNQMVINPQSKRGFIGLQKGVSKTSKGHLLQAKRALIRMKLTPFLVTRFEFSLRLKVYRRHNKHKTA